MCSPQAIKQQEWTAALQLEHGKTVAKQRAELEATATDLEVKCAIFAAVRKGLDWDLQHVREPPACDC